MQPALVSLLLLRWAWILQGAPVLPDTGILTQENFDLGRFMGRWFEVAAVSTCPHYMRRKRGNPVIVAVEMKHAAPQAHVTMAATSFRNGSCKQTTTDYGLTDIPGRFFYHIPRFLSDVESYVVRTDYDRFAMMFLLSTDRPSGNRTTIAKLYGRSMDVRDAVLDEFKALVRQQGMSDDSIIKNQNKGECTPGEQVPAPSPQS